MRKIVYQSLAAGCMCLFICTANAQTVDPKQKDYNFSNSFYLNIAASTEKVTSLGVGYLFRDGHWDMTTTFSGGWAGKGGFQGSAGLFGSYYFKADRSSFFIETGIDYNFRDYSGETIPEKDRYSVPVMAGYRVVTPGGWWKFGAGANALDGKPVLKVSYSNVFKKKF